MTFEWDLEKEKYNIAHHDGVSFSMAVKVFLDKYAIVKYDSLHSSFGKDRWQIIGKVEEILFVVFTERGEDNIRIISARLAEKEEIDEYYRNYDAR